jgi:hypothetical protein
MDIIYTFGFKLGELMGKGDSVGLGVLSLAIKDAGKSTSNISYQDLKSVIENQLSVRLKKMQVANNDKIITEMMLLLNAKQSAFTMPVH